MGIPWWLNEALASARWLVPWRRAMRSAYDLLVIGGGPAGAIAARTAAQAGHSVLLVEKRPAIGAPVRCAEAIGTGRLAEFVTPDCRWISHELERTEIVAPDGTSLLLDAEMTGSKAGYILDRKIFDRELVRQAADAGADVMIKTRAAEPIVEEGAVRGAVLERGGKRERVGADLTIAADGVESKFSRWCGVETKIPVRDIMSCCQYVMTEIAIDDTCMTFLLGNGKAPGGYLWIFPKGERMANVGIGISGNRSGPGHRAKEYLDRFVGERFPNGRCIESIVGGVSLTRPLDCTVADGLLIAGEAARIVNPLTGAGIYPALFSGNLAATVASEALSRGRRDKAALMPYDKGWRQSRLGQEIERSSFLREYFLTLSDDMMNTIIHLARSPGIGEIPTLALMKELVSRGIPFPNAPARRGP